MMSKEVSFVQLLSRGVMALALVAAVFAATPAFAQDAPVTLRVLHGIPGLDVSPDVDPELPVDVLVNDAICLLSGFTFPNIAGPFTIPAGTYNIKISLANTLEPCGNDAVVEADVPLEAGESVTIAAHLSADGMPTAGKFVNNFSAPDAGNARLIAHHLAAAPAVDVLARLGFPPSTIVFVPGAANGAQAMGMAPAGSLTLQIAPAGSGRSIFNRVVRLRPGLTYLVFAVGSLENGTFELIVEPVGGIKGTTIAL